MKPNVVLYWDIDGTLLTTNGRGFPFLLKAIEIEFGRIELVAQHDLTHGLTDFEVISAILKTKLEDLSEVSLERCIGNYEHMIGEVFALNPPRVLPNVKQALEEITSKTAWRQSIGTGNSLGGALTKLRSSELITFFEASTFFCSSPLLSTRVQVIGAAKKSLQSNEIGIVIGDTPSDILCAKKNGLKVVAISSGNFSAEELIMAKPDVALSENWTIEDLMYSIDSLQT